MRRITKAGFSVKEALPGRGHSHGHTLVIIFSDTTKMKATSDFGPSKLKTQVHIALELASAWPSGLPQVVTSGYTYMPSMRSMRGGFIFRSRRPSLICITQDMNLYICVCMYVCMYIYIYIYIYI